MQFMLNTGTKPTVSFLRASAECFVRLSYDLCVRPSVRVTVKLCSLIKTVQAKITKSSL